VSRSDPADVRKVSFEDFCVVTESVREEIDVEVVITPVDAADGACAGAVAGAPG
jgi:hypothetical protein